MMSIQMSDTCNTIVKNTFITVEESTAVEPRRRSVPPSTRLCQEVAFCKLCVDELRPGHLDSDLSTYAETETQSSHSGSRTPVDLSSLSAWSTPMTQLSTQPSFATSPVNARPSSGVRLSSKAAAFKPKAAMAAAAKETHKPFEHFKKHIAEVIKITAASVRKSAHVGNLDVSEDENGWSLVIQPRGNQVDAEILLNEAKEALLNVCSTSKSTYVMGYCGSNPFNMRPNGFEASLGCMRSAGSACWHVFKKGFCRHEGNCSKQHPAIEVPVRVLVASAQIKGCQRFASAFRQVVADLANTVTTELKKSPYVELAMTTSDQDRSGWTIELTPKGDAAAHKEYLLTLAKNALFSASNNSSVAYIMGYATKPFTHKAGGFTTMIGDMQDESRVCWDFYSKGMCSRGCACKWEHPECLLPINVVIKERSYPISLLAAVNSLATAR